MKLLLSSKTVWHFKLPAFHHLHPKPAMAMRIATCIPNARTYSQRIVTMGFNMSGNYLKDWHNSLPWFHPTWSIPRVMVSFAKIVSLIQQPEARNNWGKEQRDWKPWEGRFLGKDLCQVVKAFKGYSVYQRIQKGTHTYNYPGHTLRRGLRRPYSFTFRRWRSRSEG